MVAAIKAARMGHYQLPEEEDKRIIRYSFICVISHQEALVRTVRKRYLTSEVAANFIEIFAEILPAPCDFIVDNFNSKLKSTLESVAPLLTKIIKTKPTPPWRNDNIKRLKRKRRSAERRWRKTKLTVHFEILRKQLKTYNKTVKQARISHFSKLISDHKNNPKFLFSTFDLLTSTNFNKPSNISTDALCEDFADHFRSKIDDIRSSLLSQQNVIFNTPGSLLLPEETLESFVLVDARTLGRVFSQLHLKLRKLHGKWPRVMLYDWRKGYVFRAQTQEIKERGGNQSTGIDFFITQERVIFLDTQPMLSPSILDHLINNDRKLPPEYNLPHTYVEMQSLQIAAFLFTVCHVVIVVQDWFTDLNL
ncbi:hypothetical protein ABVT39_020980 [Epinephelus coioides]